MLGQRKITVQGDKGPEIKRQPVTGGAIAMFHRHPNKKKEHDGVLVFFASKWATVE